MTQCTVSPSSDVPYSGKLSRKKTFMIFTVLWLFAKVFSAKFGGVASFGTAKVNNPQKFSWQNRIFHQFTKVFSLKSFPLHVYGIAENLLPGIIFVNLPLISSLAGEKLCTIIRRGVMLSSFLHSSGAMTVYVK